MIKKLDIGMSEIEQVEIFNSLVDAVNELQTKVEIVEEHLHPTAKTDPYAEQRKWIGKLCKFWDNNYEKDCIYDILHHIDPNCVYKYARRELGGGYQHCEPVKPDSELIYHGE